jgi:hypothetical protein
MEPSIRNPQPIVITSETLKQSPVQKHYFYVSGVYYFLLIGVGTDSTMKAIGFNQPAAKPIFVGDEWADQALGIMKRLAHDATASPELKEGLKPKA